MRILIQRVGEACVSIGGVIRSAIGPGVLVLVGIEDDDTREDADWLCMKLTNLRIFPDEAGVMNRSLLEAGGEVLVVSQFTLYGDTKKGKRPSFTRAAKPPLSVDCYREFVRCMQLQGLQKVETGDFGADMQIALINDGPVTIWIDSKNREY